MAQDKPLMPKATAVWLIDNTALTFDQIAEFCGLHVLEVSGIADGDVAAGVRGIDPITQHQLTREEIEKAEKDPKHKLSLLKPKTMVAERKKKGPRYTPVSKRQNRPDAILWLVRNHPEISDAAIGRLLGTTKTTISAVRDRSHWNSANLEATDPVSLGLCSQLELDLLVTKAAAKRAKLGLDQPADEGDTLKSADETVKPTNDADVFADTPATAKEADEPKVDASKVFANFGEND